MRKRFIGRPSPATVIASVALFVSLGGVGYAAATGSIDSREIKNNDVRTKDLKNNDVRGKDIRTGTVTGSDVANNSLTGADILESSLGTVPSANRANTAGSATSANTANFANSATSAGNANTVGGNSVTTFSRHLATGALAETVIYNNNGLILRASCVTGLENIVADTTVANGEISSIGNDAGGGADFDVNDDDFDPGDNVELTAPAPNDQVYNFNYQGGDGQIVTGQLGSEGPTAGTCEFFGSLIGS